MAIVKMKKLRLLAMSADREALLRELLLLGCVEVSEPTELSEEAYPALSRCDSAELARVKAQHAEQMCIRDRVCITRSDGHSGSRPRAHTAMAVAADSHRLPPTPPAGSCPALRRAERHGIAFISSAAILYSISAAASSHMKSPPRMGRAVLFRRCRRAPCPGRARARRGS